MSILYGLLVAYAIIHVFTFGRWLLQSGNKIGGFGAYGIAVLTFAAYLYAMFRPN